MKFRAALLACVSVLAVAGFVAAQEAGAGKQVLVASAGGRFHITLPAEFPYPEKSAQAVEGAASKLYMFKSMHGTEGAFVFYADFEKEAFAADKIGAMIDANRDGFLESVSGKVDREEDYKFGSHAARSIYVTAKAGEQEYWVRLDCIAVKPRLYQIAFMTFKEGGLEAAKVKACFKSFALLDQEERGVLTSKDGAFSVILPPEYEVPEGAVQKVPTAAGEIKVAMYLAELEAGACAVAFNDFPEKLIEGTDPKKLLDGGRDGALRNVNGKLEKEEEIELEGNPGRKILFSTPGPKPIFGRFDFFLVKNRLYQVGYLAYERKDLDSKEIEAYFQSFELLKKD